MKVLDELERRAKALYPHARMLTGAEALALVEMVRAAQAMRRYAAPALDYQDVLAKEAADFDAALAKLEGLVGK